MIDLSLYHLMQAFREILHRFEESDVREIELEEFTIEEKIIAIIEALRRERQVEFQDLFSQSTSRMELIITLIALLELIKHSQVRVAQETAFGPVWLYRGENFGRPMGTPEEALETPAAPAPAAPAADGDAPEGVEADGGEHGKNTVNEHE